MKWSKNGYKLLKFAQKIFADLFGYSIAEFDMRDPLSFLVNLCYTVNDR